MDPEKGNHKERLFGQGNNCRSFKPFAFGIAVVAFGLALLLRNMGLLSPSLRGIIFSWEMLLIVIGFINLFDRGRVFGIILMAVGAFFLLGHNLALPFEFHHVFWPSLIILFGLFLITGTRRRIRFGHYKGDSVDSDMIDLTAIFSGTKRVVTTQNFRGGRVSAIFGGVEVDLMNAKLAEGNNVLEVSSIFGGSAFIVPSSWNVKVEVNPILGGVDDKGARGETDFSRTLIIRGSAVFGGCEIKRY